jgi:uroporphyrinogen-III synthase
MAGAGFNGLTVAAFESRMAAEMTRLIERHGGKPLVAPALQEIPLEDNSAALQFGELLLTEGLDVLVLLTGAGTTTLFEILHSRHAKDTIKNALKETVLIARGPKPVAALKALGFQPTLTVPEPNTWVDVVSTLDAHRPVKGLRVAVQEYGLPNRDLVEALKQRGANVVSVPVYRWALPEDTAPLKQVIKQILAGQVQVMLVTNAAQIDHVMLVVEQEGNDGAVQNNLPATGHRLHRSHRQRTHPQPRPNRRLRALTRKDGDSGERMQRDGPLAYGEESGLVTGGSLTATPCSIVNDMCPRCAPRLA